MTTTPTLGKRLAQERREKAARDHTDIDQADIARKVGVSVSTYSRYEADLTKPDDETLGKIASYFNVTRSWLRFGEGEKRPEPRGRPIPEPPIELDARRRKRG